MIGVEERMEYGGVGERRWRDGVAASSKMAGMGKGAEGGAMKCSRGVDAAIFGFYVAPD